jgi:hypothetical protein
MVLQSRFGEATDMCCVPGNNPSRLEDSFCTVLLLNGADRHSVSQSSASIATSSSPYPFHPSPIFTRQHRSHISNAPTSARQSTSITTMSNHQRLTNIEAQAVANTARIQALSSTNAELAAKNRQQENLIARYESEFANNNPARGPSREVAPSSREAAPSSRAHYQHPST